MSYGTGPFGSPSGASLPAQVPTALASSRRIDFTTGLYVLDENGGFESMDDTAQRVCLLVAFAEKPSDVITPQTMNAQADAIRAALAPLTNVRAPAIKLISVVVERSASGTVAKTITYRNLLTDTEETVTP